MPDDLLQISKHEAPKHQKHISNYSNVSIWQFKVRHFFFMLDGEAGHVPAGRALNVTQSRVNETGLSMAPFNPVIKFT